MGGAINPCTPFFPPQTLRVAFRLPSSSPLLCYSSAMAPPETSRDDAFMPDIAACSVAGPVMIENETARDDEVSEKPLESTREGGGGEGLESSDENEEKWRDDDGFKPRSYQLSVLRKAVQRNTIAVLETGSGKTMIAVMLMKELGKDRTIGSYKKLLIFLAPTVHLVNQQYEVIKDNTEFDVAQYYGAKGVDSWTAGCWNKEVSMHEVFVMTPQVLLDAMRNAFLKMEMVKLIVFDECHRTTGNHPYARIMKEFYHRSIDRPHIFGMTASPVIRKGAASTIDCEKHISKLESLLDSQIYTVPERLELEKCVPSAKEVNRYYDPMPIVHHELKCTITSIWEKFDALLAAAINSESGQFQDTNDAVKTSRKRLSSYHLRICHCLEDLGLICAMEAVKICMEKASAPCSMGCEFSRPILECHASFLGEVLLKIQQGFTHLPNILQNNEQIDISEVDLSVHIKMGYISPKLLELVQIIQKIRDSGQVLCLVFVERIITARVIERLIKKLSSLSRLNVAYLTGGSTSVDSLSSRSQMETLKALCAGKVNLLITTDVAEEGLHLPNCSFVIRFDLPKTVRSYIQSHGRARRSDSLYFIMIERGNTQQRDTLFDIIRSKHTMMSTAINRDPNAPIPALYGWKIAHSYFVESTGAFVTSDSSIKLIFKYCEKLPADKYFHPKPFFETSEESGFYVCKLILPANAAFPEMVGPVSQSQYVAKQLVCLNACKKLHEIGALDDHLLPVIEEHMENSQPTSDAGRKKWKELHGSTTARALSGTWANDQASVNLQTYKVDFPCNEDVERYSSFVLLISSILDSDTSHAKINLNLGGNYVNASMSPCGSIDLTLEQVEHAKLFHEFFFNGMFGKLLMKNSRSAQDSKEFILSPEKRQPWDSTNMYFLLPVENSSTILDGETWKIDWKSVKACADAVNFMNNRHLSSVLNEELLSDSKGNDSIWLANKHVLEDEEKDRVVMAVHTGKLYLVTDVLTNMSAESPFDDRNAGYPSFSDYFHKKFGIVLQHPLQPLFLLKQTHNPHNLLLSMPHQKGSSSSSMVRKKTPLALAHMPPELLVSVGISHKILRTFYLLPSLMHRVETLMLANQLKEEIGNVSTVSTFLILEAITTLRCNESFSMERLELLGDSILKFAISCKLFLAYPQKHEGQLSAQRARSVCNVTLHRLGIDRELQGYIQDAPFDPLCWMAPGQIANGGNKKCQCNLDDPMGPENIIQEKESNCKIGETCDRGHRWLCSKTVSDCVEALIGAYYVGCGLESSLHFMRWLSMDVDFDPEKLMEARNRASLWTYLPKIDELRLIESKIKYEFFIKGILLEALTHPSGAGARCCYQRMEFLGDAVLDLLITWHLFTTHKDVDPGELTVLRAASVNNKNFGRVSVKHKIHDHLFHGSGALLEQVSAYVKSFEQQDVNQSLSLNVPKVLGDILESIAGAIFLDSNLCLTTVWRVFEPLLSPIVTPSSLELPPFRELSELCSSHGYTMHISYTNDGEDLITEIKVQLEDVLLVRQGRNRSKKTSKACAAIPLLKDLEENGLLHARRPDKKRKLNTNESNEQKLSSSVKPDIFLAPRRRPLDVTVMMRKGGPRIALYELCKKLLWPLPAIESNEAQQEPPSEMKGKKGGGCIKSFVSKMTLTFPDSAPMEVKGELRLDKKSSRDSASLVMLYELQRHGICRLKEL